MKKLSKNLMMYICMFVAVFCAMTMKVEAENVTSGYLGANNGITWTYDADTKTMTLVGDGTLETVYWWEEPFEEICPDVQKIIVKNCKVDTCDGMFYGLEEVQSIEFDNFDVSQSTSLNCMFDGCRKLNSVDVSDFNTSQVENLNYMFCGCESLSSVDVSGFDTSNVTSMCGMFYDCKSLNSVDVSNFDTSQVTDMFGMFLDCGNLSSVDVSGFDTSKVMNMSYMFFGCSNLKSVDVSGFDTSNVKSMEAMFNRCASLSSLNLSGFDTSKVTSMRTMFYGCNNLSSLDISRFDTSQVTEMASMFYDCHSLSDLDVSNFDTSRVTDVNWMFLNCINLKSLDLSSFDLSSVTGVEDMLASCDDVEVLYTPKKLAENVSIELPGTYVDEQGNLINNITKELCNKTIYKQGVGQVRAFVERMYTIVLGRAAEAQGLKEWQSRLLYQEIDGATLVDMFVNSDEFINRNTSDEEYIKILYRAVLGREADADGLKMWKDMLADDWTRDYIMEGLVLSTEFKSICDSYGIIAAFDPTAESQVRSFVKRMYTVVFGRRADAVGLNDWTNHLLNGIANGAQVADGFINSQEFANRNLSNEAYVKVLYRAFFNREADEGGFNVWMNELAKGVSRRDVMKGFVHSVEFSDLCAQYGIIRGEIQ